MPRLDPPVINNCLWVYQDRSAMGPIENGIAAASDLVTDPSRSWEKRGTDTQRMPAPCLDNQTAPARILSSHSIAWTTHSPKEQTGIHTG